MEAKAGFLTGFTVKEVGFGANRDDLCEWVLFEISPKLTYHIEIYSGGEEATSTDRILFFRNDREARYRSISGAKLEKVPVSTVDLYPSDRDKKVLGNSIATFAGLSIIEAVEMTGAKLDDGSTPPARGVLIEW